MKATAHNHLTPWILVGLLLVCFGIVGRLDYEEAMRTEQQTQDALGKQTGYAAGMECPVSSERQEQYQEEQPGRTSHALLEAPRAGVRASRCIDA